MKTIALAVIIAVALAWFGPAIDDHGYEREEADNLQAAQRQASARARWESAVQVLCGQNAGYTELGDGSVQCFTKHGRKTHRVHP